jgi:hypothetical protein
MRPRADREKSAKRSIAGRRRRFRRDVDCDGGGIAVNLANNDSAVIVTLDRIRIWKDKDPDEAAVRELQGGADDKMFRFERTGLNECAALAYDRKELAAMRHK